MEIRRFDYLPDDAMAIRQAVFVDEQGFEVEFDDTDDKAVHLVGYDNGKPAAVCRFFCDDEHSSYMIGRIAVVKELRGKHLGEQMVLAAEKFIKETGGEKASLSAQLRASGFYEKLGYTKSGSEYYDEYCPHVLMSKEL